MRIPSILLGVLCVSAVSALHPASAKERPPHPRQAEIDLLVQAAGERLAANDTKAALGLLTRVTQIDSGAAPAHRMLGVIWLKAGRLDEAERAYQWARRLDDSADAWFGLGRVAVASGKKTLKRKALGHFREAIQRDWNHVEARYQLAQTLYDLGEPGAEFELQQLIRINKTYKAAYLTLSRWEEPKPDGPKEALKWCGRGLEALPGDPDLMARRLEIRMVAGDFDQAVKDLAHLRGGADELRTLPLLAQAHLAKRRLKEANAAFAAYLDRLDPKERAYYEDISLVGHSEEVKAFQALPPEKVPEFLRQFWTRRDADLAAGVNRRRLEHYRRVWVARTQFARGQTPWDRRGETYIRYGPPDFRQRSEAPDFKGATNRKVMAVRNRLAAYLYGPATNLGTAGPSPNPNALGEFIRVLGNSDPTQNPSGEATGLFDASGGRPGSGSPDLGLITGPAYPMRASWRGYTIAGAGISATVPWEGWVYTRIAGGIEFVFTSEFLNDAYDFAPVPQLLQPSGKRGLAGSHFLTRLAVYAPEKIFTEVKTETPALYLTSGEALTSYVSLADFRGLRDTSQVEVYLGIPVKKAKLDGQSWKGTRTAVIYDRSWQEVYRASERSPLQVLPESKQEILDEMKVRLPPGDYFLAVRITEGDTGRASLYQDSLRVTDYRGDGLRLSVIELARHIASAEQPDRFVKGKLRALPAPSRAFAPDQSVFVYFEVYNLRPDAQGKTRYRVDYTVRGQKGVGDLVLSGLGQLIGRSQKDNEITVSYESGGVTEQEAVYTALDLRTGKRGDYFLEVSVTDLNSGTVAARETRFKIQK